MREVIYITCAELHSALNNIAKIRHRSYLVDGLIHAYALDKHERMRCVRAQPATENELASAHDRDYLDFLKVIAEVDLDHEHAYNEQLDFYKIGYECPPFEDLPSFCS